MDKLDKIREVFKHSDHQGLINIGAPDDEYDTEALNLFGWLHPNESVEIISQKIWEVFYSSFCCGSDSKGQTFKYNKEKSESIIGKPEDYKQSAILIKAIMDADPII